MAVKMIFYEIIILSVISAAFSEYIAPGPRYNCPEKSQAIFPCKCIKESDEGLYVRCENTNLASLSVGLNNLATIDAPIEELTLHRCHMEYLFGTLFYKIKVRKLHIEHTEIETIEENIFHGINRTLQELHIYNSSLKEFPKLPLKILGNLTVLNIDYHKIATLDKDIFSESLASERLEKLHLTNGNITEFPVEAFQMLRKLKTLDLSRNDIKALKKNQFKNLRDVEILDLSFNKLVKLESSHIADLTKLSWCNVSHNELNELTRGTFARNSVLKVLNMGHNNIKRLDGNSFRGMRFLRRLYLNDNKISDIGRATFGSITRIGTIDLARNQITKIDYQMFAQLNYIEILDVSYNNITEIHKQSFKDLYLTKINISHNSISAIENNAFENCANITLLDLSHNLIADIPRDAFDVTTYAYELQFSHNLLTDFSQLPLHNMTGLQILNVSYNLITTIPKNSFPKLYELHTIDVSHNNLTFIANAVFQTLFSLRNLNFSHNMMETIKPPTFGTLPTLLSMDLSNNKLKDIAKGAFKKLTSLRYLTLENNELERIFEIPISLNHFILKNNLVSEIPELTWPTMNALISIDLSHNRLIDNLMGESFRGLLTLQSINLNSNGITRIPFQSLAVLSTLQYLYLENNNITELPKKAFGNLPVVFEVNMYNNSISTINPHAFSGLLQLLTLNMSSNAIRTIPNGAFYGLVSLRRLDLSRNFIEKLDNKTNGVLDDCLSLEKIDLSFNKISFVTRKTFPSNPYIPYKLNEIDLSYNVMPVLTYDITFGTKKVKTLNLSHNSITDLRRGVLGNLTALETLDLSYNELENLSSEPNIFNLPDNITHIYLNNNKLIKLPGKSIEKVHQLKYLNLDNNKFQYIDSKIFEKIKEGVDISFNGNELDCGCDIRPINLYLQIVPDPPESLANVICQSPPQYMGSKLVGLTYFHLNCSSNNTEDVYDSEGLPDIKFRDVSYSRGALSITWYTTAQNKDIADFYVNIRDGKNKVLVEHHSSYDTRTIKIKGDDVPTEYSNPLQACVMTKNSKGIILTWFNSQCIDLPDNFENIKQKYTNTYNYVYSILNSKMQNKRSKSARNEGTRVFYSIFHTMVVALIVSVNNYYRFI